MDNNISAMVEGIEINSEWAIDIQKCFLFNGFKYNNGRWSKQLNPDRILYFTESGGVGTLGKDWTQRVVSLNNFTTINDWNWAVTHIDELTELNIVESNI